MKHLQCGSSQKLLLILSLIILVPLSWSQSVLIQKIGSGQMDWGSYKISVTGIGPKGSSSKGSLNEARKDAISKLKETILNLNWDCKTKVKDTLNKSQTKELENLISKQFKMLGKQRYTASGNCEIEVELTLVNKIMDLIFPPSGDKLKEFSQKTLPSSTEEAFTGIIIDATGLKFNPILVPKIVNLQGEEVYGISCLERNWAITWGVVEYAGASSDFERAGDKPVYVRPLKVSEDGCSLVVSKENFPQLSYKEQLIALSHARVVILIEVVGQ